MQFLGAGQHGDQHFCLRHHLSSSAARAGGTLPLTVDLTNVTNLASAGIRALYRVREQLAARRQDLTLIAVPGSSVALILELAHLPHTADTIRNPRRQPE